MPTNFELFVLANNMAVMVNDERKSLGLREIHVVPYLQECAKIRAEEASEYYSHTRPNGEYCSTVIDYDKFEYGYFSENLACGKSTVYETFSQLRNDIKKWSAITNKNITHMGIGVFYDPNSEYGWYWCQIFTNDLKDEAEHEGQYIPKRIELNNKISVLVTDEDGNAIKDANIKISEFSNGPDTLQNIKIGKNGGISTERTYTSSSGNRTMLVKSTAEPVIFYDLEIATTYTLNAEKSGFKYISGAIGFYFNSNGKIIDSFFGNTYDGNFILKMRPIKLTIQSKEGLKLEIHAPESSIFNDIQGNVDFIISDDKKVLTYTVGTGNAIFTGFPAGEYKIYFPDMPDGYYVKNGYITQKITNTDDITWYSVYPSERAFLIQIYGINDNSEQIQVSGAEFELTFLGDGTFYEKTACNGLDFEITGNSIKFTVSVSARTYILPAGDYQLTELTPPDSHEKALPIFFTLGDGEITNLQNAILSGNTTIKVIHHKLVLDLWTLTRENVIRVYDLSYPQENFLTNNNGLAILRPSSCISTHNADTWDVSLVHPIDEWGKWKNLLVENVLKVDGQLFRIDTQEAEYSENGGFITVHARHITGDMADDLIEEATFEGGTGQDFINFAFANGVMTWNDDYNQEHPEDYYHKPYKFDGYSDIDTFLDGCDYVNTSLWGAIVGVDNCLINRYGGELYRDNFYFSVCKRMENAKDNAFYLRYSHDMSGIKQRIDYTNFCTNLNCYDNFGNMLGVSYTGESRDMIHHARRKMYKFNYKDADTGAVQLPIDAMALWETINTPTVAYEITFASAKSDPRYSDIKMIQNFNYGDSGTIHCPELDIDTVQKITEVVKDEIIGEKISMKLGNVVESLVRPTFLGSTISSGHGITDNLSARVTKLESSNITNQNK